MPTNRFLWIGLALWCALVIFMTLVTDLIVPESKTLSDFHLNFWAAGYLVVHQQFNSIYPDINATSPLGTKFDEIVHQLFPNVSAERYGIFLYLPLMAVLCAPFAIFPANIGLLIWQTINILGLGIYSWVSHSWVSSKLDAVKWWQIFLLLFTYLPIFSTLWIGQCSMLFGLFPLALGYYFARKNQNFVAGLLWSVLFIKPQYCTIPFFTAVATRRWSMLLGFASGCAAILLTSYLCLTPDVFRLWLHAASQLGEKAISGQIVVPSSLVACIPGCILVSIPPEARTNFKWIIYAGTAAVSLLSLAAVLYKASKKFKRSEFLDVSLLLNILFLPTYSRLLNYDLVLFVLAGHLACAQLPKCAPETKHPARRFVVVATVALNIQILCALFLPKVNLALLFAALLATIALWSSKIILDCKTSNAD